MQGWRWLRRWFQGVAACALAGSAALAQQRGADPIDGIYRGTLGKEEIVLEVGSTESRAAGLSSSYFTARYFYWRYGVSIFLYGHLMNDGRILLREYRGADLTDNQLRLRFHGDKATGIFCRCKDETREPAKGELKITLARVSRGFDPEWKSSENAPDQAYYDLLLDFPLRTGPEVHLSKGMAYEVQSEANPTAALVACVDFDGIIYVLSEYYQPGLSPRQHRPNLEQLYGFRGSEAVADPSIFYKTQAQADGTFKAIADLYAEEGIVNLAPAPSNSELTGMERILNHWLDLDEREPTLRIVCPRGKRDIGRPIYGMHNDGCPNLLWELRRARREELSSSQLVSRNPTERIVDKDNHLRDCLKYLCLALPEPTAKPAMLRAQEAIKGLDATSAMIRWNQIMAESEKEEAPIVMGRRGAWNARRVRR